MSSVSGADRKVRSGGLLEKVIEEEAQKVSRHSRVDPSEIQTHVAKLVRIDRRKEGGVLVIQRRSREQVVPLSSWATVRRAIRTLCDRKWRSIWRRKEFKTRTAFHEDSLGDDASEDPSGHLERSERDEWVWWALAELAPEDRAVLVLRVFERLTRNEVAQVLGETIKRVRRRESAAKSELRRLLAPVA